MDRCRYVYRCCPNLCIADEGGGEEGEFAAPLCTIPPDHEAITVGFCNNTVTICESMEGVIYHPGRTHADARMSVHGIADGIAMRDSRASIAAAHLSPRVQTCEALQYPIT
jgi:hypothetical protein